MLKVDTVKQLFDIALTESVNAVIFQMGKGLRPFNNMTTNLARYENGFPTLVSHPLSYQNDFLDYASLLESFFKKYQTQDIEEETKPYLRTFRDILHYIINNPDVTPAYLDTESERTKSIQLSMQLECIINAHFARFGEVPTTNHSRISILRPVFSGLFNDSLNLALFVPIALTHFDFDHARINSKTYIIRMSDELHKQRWSFKAYGASGHDSVLAAATHAVVFSGWSIKNGNHLGISQSLSQCPQEGKDLIDRFFAALRLETGIETGYAQGFYLARGWRSYRPSGPEVFAFGARRYPETFDNFYWIRNDLSKVTYAQIDQVSTLFNRISEIKEPRLELSIKRFNAASLRHDSADAILDASIALEILLGDSDNQAISWKLKMRAAALAGINGDKDAMERARRSVSEIYGLRSTIVHGALRRRDTIKEDSFDAGKKLALDTLRSVIISVIRHPKFLDPLVIDKDLMMIPSYKEDTL